MKNLILASTSTLHSQGYIEYLLPSLKTFFNGVTELLFIPYARPSGLSYDTYTERVRNAFKILGIAVNGIHEYEDPKTAIEAAKGIFTGGGNTFLLLNDLYKLDLMSVLRTTIFNGIPYLGTSAGSNIAGITMQNTNDMPIIYPPSFKTLGAIPFNINAHYINPKAGETHMGETRETRIMEFHKFNTIPVVGLREGSWVEVHGNQSTLRGTLPARIFLAGKEAYDLSPGREILTD